MYFGLSIELSLSGLGAMTKTLYSKLLSWESKKEHKIHYATYIYTFQNVTQVVAEIQLPDNIRGRLPTVLRTHYSELRRMESQGFLLFHSSPLPRRLAAHTSREQENCCFKLGYINQHRR